MKDKEVDESRSENEKLLNDEKFHKKNIEKETKVEELSEGIVKSYNLALYSYRLRKHYTDKN